MASRTTGSTVVLIAAWAVAAFVALKYLPGILKELGGSGGGGGTNVAGNGAGAGGVYSSSPQPAWYGGQNGQGGVATLFNGGYSNGLPSGSGTNGETTIGQALQVNGLSPDSAQGLAEIYNVQNYANADGSTYDAAQQAGLIPQYDDPTVGLSIAQLLAPTLDDSAYALSSPGDVSDYVAASDPSDPSADDSGDDGSDGNGDF